MRTKPHIHRSDDEPTDEQLAVSDILNCANELDIVDDEQWLSEILAQVQACERDDILICRDSLARAIYARLAR